MKSALIFGLTGQDGAYLSEFLLKKDYQVFGTYRRTSHKCFERIESFNTLDKIQLITADLGDQISINNAIKKSQPDEIYNLAAQSFVGTSFDQPFLTYDVTGLGAARIFEAVREFSPHSKVYQASSSEMFGNTNEIKTENSRLYPASPYGVAKVFAHKSGQFYREAYDLFISCGILFNHESPFRGIEFVTRKITYNLAAIKYGKSKKFSLGNIYAKRDWGFAGDYVEAMWLMLQQNEPDNYVVATGESHSVEEFLNLATEYSGLGDWHDFVEISEENMRPTDIDELIGNASKAKEKLNWKPKTSFKDLVRIMVEHDMNYFKLGMDPLKDKME